MTPIDITQTIDAVRTYGAIFVFIVCPIALLICYLAYRYVRRWVDERTNHIVVVEAHVQDLPGLVNEIRETNKVFHETFKRHVEDTDRLNSEEHWKHCQVDRCPYLQKHFAEHGEALRDVVDMIRQFSGDATASRQFTQESINTIMRRFDDFATAMLALSRKNGFHTTTMNGTK
jgi:hypothetical protein